MLPRLDGYHLVMKKHVEKISLTLIFGLLAMAGIALGCGGGGGSGTTNPEITNPEITKPETGNPGNEETTSNT